jgi:hypothetical protein
MSKNRQREIHAVETLGLGPISLEIVIAITKLESSDRIEQN